MNAIRSFFDNDSPFGRLCTRCGIIIVANLLFVVCCLPVISIGAGWAALHYTCLRTLREKELNPFSTFWKGLKDNWKQATVAWLGLLLLGSFLALEIYWCTQFTGAVSYFRYGLIAVLVAEVLLAIYLFPVMASFAGNIRQLLFNSLYFAIHRPLSLICIAVVHVIPLAITWLDRQRLPLYAFLWAFFGFAAVAIFTDFLLLKQINPYQRPVDNGEDEELVPRQKSDREVLKEMERMGF